MTSWRCRPYRSLLVDHAGGLLRPAQQAALERHLAGCEACARDLAALREMPALLQTTEVPDPGEAFWLQQRRAIARATRNLAAPRPGWQIAWLREGLRVSVWRWPLAVAASLLVALFVYRYAERAPAPVSTALGPQIAALDAESLAEVHELVQAMVPQDEYLHPAASQDEALLAALRLDELISAGTEPAPVPSATDLSENELGTVDDLLGGVG